MASAPRQASQTSNSASSEASQLPLDREPATVEEFVHEFDLIATLRDNVSSGAQSVESIFATVANASRVMSGADGTALAVDTNGLMVCRARSGSMSPSVGSSMSRESGISGQCLRNATMLVCHDTLVDSRVDAEVCAQLGIRSVVAVPLLEGAQAIGILEAFAARPNAFDGEALSSMRSLAEIAQIAYLREHPSAPAPPVTALAAPPVAAVTAPPPAVPAPRPTKYIPRTFTREELAPLTGGLNKSLLWKGALAVVALLVTAAVAWWAWHTPDETTSSVQTAHAAAKVEAASTKPLAIQVLPKPAPGTTSRRSTSHSDNSLQNAAELEPVRQPATETASTALTTTTPTRTTTVRDSEPAPEPPSVSVVASANPDQLTGLTSIQPQLPAAGPPVSKGVVEPVLLHKVDATYPMQARTQRLSGKVTLVATIGADGNVHNLTVMTGSPMLAAAAKTAVQQWRYRPATLNGNPIDVQKEITFLFEQP